MTASGEDPEVTDEPAQVSVEKGLALAMPALSQGTLGRIYRPEALEYTGASTLELKPGEAEKLAAAFTDDALDVKPTGEVFVSQVHYRRRLNAVFGPGQWALVPRGQWTVDNNIMMREYVLQVRGHFVSEAVGEQEYHPNNDRMSWADAAEGCKSNALTRTCKDLGIASECWDRIFANRWRAKHCVQVWVEDKKRPQWRRKDAEPFYKEGRPVAANTPPAAKSQEDAAMTAKLHEAVARVEGKREQKEAPPTDSEHEAATPKNIADCPHCGSDKTMKSKFPKKGAFYCMDCKNGFDA